MSARHVGIPAGLTEQPGWKLTKNSTGLVTITTTYSCHADRIVELLPPVGAPHPRFSFCQLDEITGAREEGDLAKIDCVFKGPEPTTPESPTPPAYKLVASTREEPIETNDRYSTVTEDELATIKDVLDGKKKPSASGLTGMASELLSKKLRGQDSYLRRALVWREEVSARAGHTSISAVGKISVPVGGAPDNGDGNWLLASMESTKQGAARTNSREWMASGPEGWDPDFYT